MQFEPGSFRDWDSRVFYDGERVLRVLSDDGLQDWLALSQSKLFAAAVAEGKLVPTARLDEPAPQGAAAVLEHERVPFVSYPYEWTFSMLRDAALLQLELLRRALDENLILKDALAVQRPVARRAAGLHRHRLVRAAARGRAVGRLPAVLHALPLPAAAAGLQGRRLPAVAAREPRRDRARRRRGGCSRSAISSGAGVLDERRAARAARAEALDRGGQRDVKSELQRARVSQGADRRQRARLEQARAQARVEARRDGWSGYGATTSYNDADAARKDGVRPRGRQSREWGLVWDIGCNEGRHSRIAAENARYVVALDADAAVVDRSTARLRAEGGRRSCRSSATSTDPSPALGWRGLERQTLEQRGRPELTLCLASCHHVAISGNVPVPEFLAWLRRARHARS